MSDDSLRHTEIRGKPRREKALNMKVFDERILTMLRSDMDYAEIMEHGPVTKIRGLVFDELYECMQDEGADGVIKVLNTIRRHGERTDKGIRRSS